MTIRNFEVFAQVAECGKMNEAARRLYISQSSVSQAVAEIERTYGIRLFERLGRRLCLTPAGRELLQHVRRLLMARDAMDQWLEQAADRKIIRIGASLTVGTSVLVPLLDRLSAQDPEIVPEVLVANTHILEEKLLRDDLDLALVEGKVSDPQLTVRHAIEDRMVLVCGRGHPFYGRNAVALEELSHQRLILREVGSGTRAQLEDQLKLRRIPFQAPWTCYNTETVKAAVIGSYGVTLISERLVREECADGRLWACTVQDLVCGRFFDLVVHQNKVITGSMRRLMDLCTATDGLPDKI